MFKDEYKKKYDAIAPDPAFRHRLEERIEDMKNIEKRRWMRRSTAAVVVLAAMLALTTVGFATGAYRSVFAAVANIFQGDPVVDYEHMQQQAATDFEHQTVNFENGLQADVALEQSYYNGKQLALGWSMKAGESNVRFLEKDDPLTAQSEEVVWSIELDEKLGAENEAEFMRRGQQDGWAAVTWYDYWLNDQSYLADRPGEVDPSDGRIHPPKEAQLLPESDVSWQDADGARISYQEIETPLPQAAQGKDSLWVARKVSCCQRWFIFDGEKTYSGSTEPQSVEVVFEIPRSEDYAEQTYQQQEKFPEFTADITLTRTPIKAEFEIVNHVSDEWKTAWAGYEGYLRVPLNLEYDLVFDYEILVDGKATDWESGEFNGTNGTKGWFLLPADAKQVTFRPVYANSGAHADEGMIINLG